MTDRVRERWAAGEPAVGAWVMQSDPSVGASLASVGFDAVTTDLQHGRMREDALDSFAAGVGSNGAVPLARLRWNAPDEVMRALDLGVRGVIGPMVGSGDEAAALVAASRYPPVGSRSYGPIAGAFGSGVDYTRAANDQVLVFAMIETADGLACVEDIAATSGLDGLYVGPADLSLSLGLDTFADLTDARLLEALDAIVTAARRHGVVPGVHAPSPGKAVAMIERGFAFVTPAIDEDLVSVGAAEALARTRVSR